MFIDTKIFSWNYRGLSNSRTVEYLFDIMHRLKPDFICLLETKTNSDRILRFCNRLKPRWDWATILASGFSGGILILWRQQVGCVTPIAISKLALHLVITTSFDSWVLFAIYNSQMLSDHKALWTPSLPLLTQHPLGPHGGFQCHF